MLTLSELLGLGVIVGFAGGTLGAGGGFVLVPVLYTILGWPLIAAVAASNFCGLAVSVSATGTYAAAELIEWRLGIIMVTATVTGAAVGASVARWIPTATVALVFSAVAALAARRMWRPQPGEDDDRATIVASSLYLWGLPGMLLVGAASAILGLGGGVFMVPIMTTLLHVPMRRAVATSVFMVGLNAATAAVIYYRQGHVPVVPSGILAAGVLLGSLVGSTIAPRLPVVILRRAFAGVLLFLAVRLVWRVIG